MDRGSAISPQTPAAELARLAQAPDAAVRAAVARHPNTPAGLLAELGAEFPGEVLGNPALPLLRLAEPGLLTRWPARTLEALTGQPAAPDWLLRLAAAHVRIEVQLAVAVRPALPDDVLTALARSPFWTVREIVARKPELAPGLLAALARDLDYGVRLSVAGRSDLPPEVYARLRQDPHPLVQAVILLSEA